MGQRIILLLVSILLISNTLKSQQSRLLNADAFERKLSVTPNGQVLDVRTKSEFEANRLFNALNADYNNRKEFDERTAHLDKQKPVFVYCLSGGRSAAAARLLTERGYQVYDLQGGMNAWKNANKPYEKDKARKSPGMSVTHFEQKVAKGLVLVDFGARWCPPCKKLQPILEELSHQEAASLRLLQVDVDENETLTKAKSIEVLPVLLLYKDGKQVWRHEGFADKQAILAQIQKYR